MANDWNEALQSELTSIMGAQHSSQLAEKYQHAFSTNYREDSLPAVVTDDIQRMEKLSTLNPIDINFYIASDGNLHLRLFQFHEAIPLSDVMPMLENMDLRTFDERPYKVRLGEEAIWISDFTVNYVPQKNIDLEKVKTLFQDAFVNIRFGFAENDGFNKLVLAAQLSWQEIIILRAYAKYLRQTGFIFSQSYIEQALVNNAAITKNVVALFLTKFALSGNSIEQTANLEQDILLALENVVSLDEDRIIRRLLDLVKATLRTTYFQHQADGRLKPYLALKLSSRDIPELPLPLPLYEIFVYSPRFEAIHLRNAKVARGGIRWSDRREDFRTEILGLMKAQKVKNAVIVPSGAKGGFVLKTVSNQATRDVVQAEVVFCYQEFIRGLLDLTDNLQNGKVIKPKEVVCFDDDDTYLVVAADKGTSTFSDLANSISKDYQFWLGDAFASGGSEGYDHKKMGITARGTWESINRHFLELNINPQVSDFSVVGIGDMSGDVFGNGMIYSAHIKLVAAFDHRHIFLDPNPELERAFAERKRLFQLPTSSWEDYNPALISSGGGVFKRSSKSIRLSPEMKKVLNTNAESLVPNELIQVLLKAPVDLLFNGGIGTYVKASSESHADVGDKTNDFCRVNGNELHCRVVGEGGNLGFTQLGRVEYALIGGLINTDFIDNSAGVDCSDHEVNIKILLDHQVQKKTLDDVTRNIILSKMTEEVLHLVLDNNYNQALALSVANSYASRFITIHQNYIKELESSNVINRVVDSLPDDKKIAERKAAGLGLMRPELAVLMAYTKIHIKSKILSSDIPDHPFIKQVIFSAFPESLRDKFSVAIERHYLHREIIATQLSNQIVNDTGIAFVYNLQNETGSTAAEILRACIVAGHVFETTNLLNVVESLDYKINIATQYELSGHIRRLTYLTTRWFLRHKQLSNENLEPIINDFSACVKLLEPLIPTLMGGATKIYLETLTLKFEKAGISKDIARRIAGARAMYTSLNIIQVATKNNFDLFITARIYFAVGEYFNLLWFRDRLANDAREGYWETLSRLTLRDELDVLQKLITTYIMMENSNPANPRLAIEQWIAKNHRAMQRWEKILEMLHNSTNVDYVMFFIALRELSDLVQSTGTRE